MSPALGGEFCISHEMASAATLILTKTSNLTLPDKDFSFLSSKWEQGSLAGLRESGYKVLKTPGLGCFHLPTQVFYEINLINLLSQVKKKEKNRLQGLNEKNFR